MKTRIAAALIFSLTFFSTFVSAQDDARVDETLQVNLVEIPVNVFDSAGNPIRGLKPENFEVYDEGKRRKITHFQEIDLANLSTDAPERLAPAARRNFLIAFDLSNSSPKGLIRARAAAEDFVRNALGERDLVSVAVYSVEEGFRILTAFTTDRELVQSAIRMLEDQKFLQTRDPLLLAGSVDPGMVRSSIAPGDSELDRELQEITGLIASRMEGDRHRYEKVRIEKQLRTFGIVARSLDAVRGRKQVILLTEGFDGRAIHGRETENIYEREDRNLARLRGEIWRFDMDEEFGSVATQSELNAMAHLFRRSDVVLHTIDIAGIRSPTDARAGSHLSSNESLFLLSSPTGGEVFKNSNDFADAFARMLKQQEVVYVLGFQTQPSGNPGKFRDLKVKVRVVGYSGLHVSHRAGYYEPRQQMMAVEQILSATDILMNDIPFEEIPTSILVTPLPQKDRDAEVPVVVEISGDGLTSMVPGDVANGELFIYAFDDSGTVRDHLFQIFSLDLSRVGHVLKDSGLKYYGILSLPPGDYTVKTLVRVAESGLKGFTRARIHVPEYGEQAILPPLMFEDPGRWILLRGVSKAGGDIDYPFTLGQESFIPAARPVISGEEAQEFALFTYNFDPERLRLVASLNGPDGQPTNAGLTLVGRTEATGDGLIKLLLRLDPSDLAPGDYRMDVRVPPGEGMRPQEVSIDLHIRP
ncbi:MAG: VWA domain-containing protein [Acidobacteria bacterium]|nr:VWA domain-containing protein [Acidobacteriota bacterium]